MKAKNIIFVLIAVFIFTQCADEILKEDFYSGANIETLVSTESGLNNLVTACYVSTKVFYGKEYGWDVTTNGTDLWTYAADADAGASIAKYLPGFNNQAPSRLAVVWAEFYKALNTCNTALFYIPDADIDAGLKQTRLAEVYFLRAFYNWHIVELWGNVHLSDKRITEPEYNLTRSSVEDFYTLILSDLDSAVKYLPETLEASDYGRVHKYAALAMRARAHLYWSTEYMEGNAFDKAETTHSAIGTYDHKQQAAADAQAVIDANYALYDNYNDIWEMDNNSINSNLNTENIWAINYSSSEYAIMGVDPDEYTSITSITGDPKPFSEREGGNDGHMIFGMRWFNVYKPNSIMTRDDGDYATKTEPTRPFCRYMPTKFFMDLYKADIDQRFYGTFNTVFKANNFDSTVYYKFKPSLTLGTGEKVLTPPELILTAPINYGDTALVLYKDEVIADEDYYVIEKIWRLHRTRNHFFLDMSMLYDDDGNILDKTCDERRAYFDIKKWYDSTRVHNRNSNDPGSMRGQRDFIVFRLPEMYYILAEANLGDNQQAAYDALLTIANKRAVNGDGAAMLSAYGVSSAGDVDIDFILDDKAREMAGEHNRWFDLKRTGKTLERIRAHNPDARENIAEKHIIRPIPQVELDAIENKEDFASGYGIY